MAAAIAMPLIPELSPIISDIAPSSTTDSISPTIRSIESIEGRMFSNDFHAFFNALSVLPRSLQKEIISQIKAAEYKMILNNPVSP